MTASMAVCFLGFSCVILIGLYVLLQAGYHVILLVLVLVFVLAGANSLTLLLHAPLRALVQSRFGAHAAHATLSLGFCGSVDLPFMIAVVPALALASVWFAFRRATWAWLLQDLFGLCVCLVFLRTLRLSSLRVASILLSLMFFYDIFMVFLSPFLFHRSVMMSVATAGDATATDAGAGVCLRFKGERMPMLFVIPRFSFSASSTSEGRVHDYGPGAVEDETQEFAMLGLGDVVVPGLLLTLAARADIVRRVARASRFRAKPQSHADADSCVSRALLFARENSYWSLAVFGYLLGLLMALLANMFHLTVNGVEGQPALLYLVPCTIAAVAARAYALGELRAIWSGASLELRTVDEVCASAGSDADGQQRLCAADYNPML